MTVVWWIVAVALVLVALKLIILWAEPYLSFVPRKGPTPPPSGFQTITITASDGARLVGWQTLLPSDGPVFLYFCGNAGNLQDREEMMARGARAGLSIIAFNYRGTGESEGRATESSVHRDAVEIFDYIVRAMDIAPERIIVWGHSIGGAVASELACQRAPAGVVMEGTFRSALVMARRMLPFLPVSWFMTYKFDNEKNASKLERPLFLIHGATDFTIPARDSEVLHRIAKCDKELWLVDGADHNDVYEVGGDAFFERLAQFGQRVTKAALVIR